MVRENLSAGSRNIFLVLTVTNGTSRIGVTYRQVQDGPTLNWPEVIEVPTGTSVRMAASRGQCPDAFTMSATAANGPALQVQIPDDYPPSVYWGFATAGEGAQSAARAFVTYGQLSIAAAAAFPQNLTLRLDTNKPTLTWNNWCHTVLQTTSDLGSGWQTIVGATSPWTVSTNANRAFFRLKTEP
jgi:hypothetical protein